VNTQGAPTPHSQFSTLDSPLIRPGYKQTEVGEIPSDWDLVPFSEFVDFQNGINAGKEAYGQGFRFANVLEIITNSHLNAESVPGRIQISDSAAKRYALEPGDYLFNRTSEIPEEVGLASVYMGTERVVFGGFVIRGRPRDLRLRRIYAGYGLRSPLVRKQIVSKGQGAIRSNIGQTDLRDVLVLIPKDSEQEAIAGALGDADALIESLKALIAKKRQIKQGAMQELLTGNTRLPGFTGEWETSQLGEIASIQRGASPRPIDSPIWFNTESQVGWVRISDVTSAGMYLSQTTQHLSPLGIKHSRPVGRGSLIMSICATVGRPIITAIDTCIHDGFVVFDSLRVNREFLYYVLGSIENDWSRHGQTGSQMNLNTGLISRTEVPVAPTPDEQEAIAAVLSDMDAEIATLEAKLAKARQIKQGMMQELLTGKTRLVESGKLIVESEGNTKETAR